MADFQPNVNHSIQNKQTTSSTQQPKTPDHARVSAPHSSRHKPSSSVTAPNPSSSSHLASSSKQKTPDNKSKSIGHYVLGKTIGEGTFGKVKLGTHILTGQKVAIKILEKNRIVDQADVERVSRQIHILKRIRHDNIIQLYEIIENPKQLYLIMEYASGGQLFDYIVKHSRVKEKNACRFFQQIIDGIQYLEQLLIVHRDLKPQNLLLDFHKRIKIVDFGLSNIYKDKQLLQTACGSPCYAAPQMIAGKRYKGVNVDIWSCGVILFAMICGYLPFQDPNTATLYKKILNGDFQIPKFVSAQAQDLIKGILAIDPSKRMTIDQIRRHAWFTQVTPQTQSGTLGLTTGYGLKVGVDAIPIDMRIVTMLSQYGFNSNQAKKYLEANKHNHATTTYYLLLKKIQRTGGLTISQFSKQLNFENKDPAFINNLSGKNNNFNHNNNQAVPISGAGLSVSGMTGLQTQRAPNKDNQQKILSQTLRPDDITNIAGYATARRHNQMMNQTIPINQAIKDGVTRRDQHSPDLFLSQKNKQIQKFGQEEKKTAKNNNFLIQSRPKRQMNPRHD